MAAGVSAQNEATSITKEPDNMGKMQLHMNRFEVGKGQRQAGNAKTGAVVAGKTAVENPKATTGANQLQ